MMTKAAPPTAIDFARTASEAGEARSDRALAQVQQALRKIEGMAMWLVLERIANPAASS